MPICQLCNKQFKMITNTHLRDKHQVTPEKYMEMFPAAVLASRATERRSKYAVRPNCFKPGCTNTVSESWNKYCSYSCRAIDYQNRGGGIERQTGSNNWAWKGGWYSLGKKQKNLARERDKYTCQRCGVSVSGKNAHVHHKIPERCFDNPKSAHALDNLITLCNSCHNTVEWRFVREMYNRAVLLDKVINSSVTIESIKNTTSMDSFKDAYIKVDYQ